MSKHTEAIREALAAGPTPGPWVAYCRDCDYVEGHSWSKSYFLQWEVEGVEEPDGRGSFYQADAQFIAACNPVNIAALLAERDAMLSALCSIGVIGPGYCFCSHDRDPDKTDHQPECADARAAIRKATED